ncbi:MAG: hypothetical protein U5L96_16470 [Owenweeksia sp.]|nr:hypothetical protein [Owenweeksia sp.]
MGVTYLDITGISRQALNAPNLVADDGLHFSAQMHRLWVETYYDKFLANLKP